MARLGEEGTWEPELKPDRLSRDHTANPPHALTGQVEGLSDLLWGFALNQSGQTAGSDVYLRSRQACQFSWTQSRVATIRRG